eukprot:s3944_g1.t1
MASMRLVWRLARGAGNASRRFGSRLCPGHRLGSHASRAVLSSRGMPPTPGAPERSTGVYLVWSSQRGFLAENHSRAYWRLAECFLTELEQRNARLSSSWSDRHGVE